MKINKKAVRGSIAKWERGLKAREYGNDSWIVWWHKEGKVICSLCNEYAMISHFIGGIIYCGDCPLNDESVAHCCKEFLKIINYMLSKEKPIPKKYIVAMLERLKGLI